MRIATWNVNSLRARLEFVEHFLREREPEIVALQELKMTEEQFPHERFRELGYRCAVYGQKAWNGVAVIARGGAEPRVVERGFPGGEEFGSRLITVEIGGLLVTSVYCPNGKRLDHDDFPRKLAWFERLREHLERSRDRGEPLIVAGDFNICPAAIDSWNEERLSGSIFHTDEERARLRALLDWVSSTCSATVTQSGRSSAGGTIAAVRSTGSWA